MRFTVTASPDVLDMLAIIWMNASDRGQARRAADEIDQILRTSPIQRGEKHGEDLTLTITPPTVTYTVSPDDYLVTIKRFTYHQAE